MPIRSIKGKTVEERLAQLNRTHQGFFFWNGKPYRRLEVSKRKNYVKALDMIEDRRVVFRYNDWVLNHKRAYTTYTASVILDRHLTKLHKWIKDGKIPPPYQLPYEIDRGLSKRAGYLWTEEDLLRAIDFMETTPAKGRVPSRAEIRALFNEDEVVMFVKTNDGEFVPVWKA